MEAPDVVLCPLVDVEIENIDCIENSDAVDGIIKKETVPDVHTVPSDQSEARDCKYLCQFLPD